MSINNRYLFVIFLTTVLFLIYRLINFISVNSINVIYWDQWDIYNTLFNNQSYWESFLYIHSPHRQGFSFIIERIILENSNWNTKFISYYIGFLFILAGIFYSLFIKKHFYTKKNLLIFLPIFLMVFSLSSFEIILITPNSSHGPFPLFLFSLLAFIFQIKNIYIKNLLLLLLDFLLVYSGFGVFAGIIYIGYYTLEFIHSLSYKKDRIKQNLVFLTLSILIFFSFFYKYKFHSAADCFRFPHDRPIEYIFFIIYLFSYFIGFKNNTVLGFLYLIVVLFSIFYLLKKLIYYVIKNKKIKNLELYLFFLISFSLIFSINTAIGRVCFGYNAANSSRYIVYLIPGFIGLYFLFLHSKMNYKIKNVLLLILIFLLIEKEFNLNNDFNYLYYSKQGKILWINCMLEGNSLNKCQKLFQIYPNNESIKEKINYLKENKLNFYYKYKN